MLKIPSPLPHAPCISLLIRARNEDRSRAPSAGSPVHAASHSSSCTTTAASKCRPRLFHAIFSCAPISAASGRRARTSSCTIFILFRRNFCSCQCAPLFLEIFSHPEPATHLRAARSRPLQPQWDPIPIDLKTQRPDPDREENVCCLQKDK